MAKEFTEISLSANQCKQELQKFETLLTKDALRERADVLPFFKQATQLTAFIGTYVPGIARASQLAYEFEIAGDFVADIVVGDRENQTFCMVELEGATLQHIFVKTRRNTTEWSRQFERGFSQLVDWFCKLDDLKNTAEFREIFGHGYAKFHGLLVIGRSAGISEKDARRLRWREDKVVVDSHRINCVTYDELYQDLHRRLASYPEAAASGE